MSRKVTTDPDLRETSEWAVLLGCTYDRGAKAGKTLQAVAGILTPPLSQWFADPARRAIAVALDAVLRGEIKCSDEDVAGYLGGLPHATLHEIATGKPVLPWRKAEYEGSALVAIGGFNALTPSPEILTRVGGASAGASATILRHLVERERSVDALREIAKQISSCSLQEGPASVLASGIDRLTSLITGATAGRNIGDCLGSAVDNAILSADLRAQGQSTPVTWGIPQLDTLCPLRAGMLVVLAAPPGVGKTSLALQAASATSAIGGRDSVGIGSLEMTGEELALILAGQELGIAPVSIREWSEAARRRETDIRAVIANWKSNNSLLVQDVSDNGQKQTAAGIISWLRQRKAISGGRLGLGILDYLQILDREPRQSEYDAISSATRQLKKAAMSLRIPILCLSQMNREGRKSERSHSSGELTVTPRPRLEDLRGSGSIEQDADAVVFIHQSDPNANGPSVPCEIIVAKQRGGAAGSIHAVFHKRHQRFVYQPQEIPGLPDTPEPRPSDIQAAQPPHESEDLFAKGNQ